MPELIKPERISLLNNPSIKEAWIQEQIAKDPSLLGLGDLVLKDKERMQPRAGRLDLLLQDTETMRRYEVELQLGRTDETHIIRTIEYWDIEKKRYPQYDHCAVIIAEDITSRFLNIISLFNGHIPLIAIQMQAFSIGEHIMLIFTKVLDEMPLGLVDEDEEVAEPTDRNYWLAKGTKETISLTDEAIELVKAFVQVEPKYTKTYIGLAKDSQPMNFVTFIPRKKHLRMRLKLAQTEDVQTIIDEAGFDDADYNQRWETYRMNVSREELHSKAEALQLLMKKAYEAY